MPIELMAVQMSANLSNFYPLLLMSCLQACSTYPLPQNFSGYNTEKIIANVRCEARDAVRAAAIYHLEKYETKVTRDQTGKELADNLQNHPEKFLEIDIHDLRGPAQKIFSYYKNTQISYDFSLQGVEFNSQGINLGLSRQFGLRKDTLGFDNQADRTRDVTRAFFVWDKFEKLIKIGDEYCNSAKSLNIVYPITGSMPIADLILNYIEANKFGILAPDKSAVAAQIIGTDKAPAIPQMGDTISFKTKLISNISPTINYNPVGMGLFVSALTVTNDNYREDTHRVTVTVSTAEQPVEKGLKPGQVPHVTASDASRLSAAQDANQFQRVNRLENAIIGINSNISRLTQ